MTERVDTLVRGTHVNVLTGRREEGASIAVDDGEVVAMAERPADRVLEAAYVAPGLIDAHLHVESSMVTAPRYAEAAIDHGVTAVVTDPHEAANVLGAEGVRAMLADARRTPLKARFTVPSHVPVSDLQDAGATLGPGAVADLLDAEEVVALGEVNVADVLEGDPDAFEKIRAARERGLVVDGHVPGATEAELQRVARHLDTDHESVRLEEARRKAALGLRVFLREGSTSHDLAALCPLVEEVDARRLSLCTDDRDVADLVEEGGVNVALRRAVAEGVDPVTALRMATVNTAEAYGLPFGRLAPGAPADLVLLEDLRTWSVDGVMIDGVLNPHEDVDDTPSAVPTGTVAFDPVSPADLAVECDDPRASVPVNAVRTTDTIRTERVTAAAPRADDRLLPDPANDLAAMATIERHGNGGGIGTGFVRGLGLDRGAVGSTLAHDAHNCVVAGASHAAMARVANRLRELGGGLCVLDPDGEGTGDGSFAELPLPRAGLMSDAPLAEVVGDYRAVARAAAEVGFDPPGGITELTFLALEGIPEIRLTNNGLVDVTERAFVPTVRP